MYPSLVGARRTSPVPSGTAQRLLRVDLPQLPREEGAEPAERPEAGGLRWPLGTERGELLEEVERGDPDDAGGDGLRPRFVCLTYVPLHYTSVQRRRVGPDVGARVVSYDLVALQRDRVTGAVPEEEPIEHPFGRRILLVDEEVEDALLVRKPAAESIAADPTLRRSLAPRISHEPIEVVDLDGEVEHQAGAALAALPGPTLVVVLCERDVTFHLLGEAHALARVHLTPLLFVPRYVPLPVVPTR